MVVIKIFLASSITEFSSERKELEAFVNSLNNIYVHKGIFFELIVCEDLSNAVQQEGSQETYNQQIRASQYFYVIFGRKAGRFTLEEFDVALSSFRRKGEPKLYTYFMVLPEGEHPDRTLIDFMRRLENELHYYHNKYTHIDSIKLNLLMELVRDPRVGGSLKLKDGQAQLDGSDMMSMDNIPLFSKNEAIQKLLAEKKALEQEFAALAAMGDSETVQRMRLRNSSMRNEIAGQIHAMEMDVLGLCRQIEENRQIGKTLNWREIKAMDLVDAGEYEAAKAVLRDSEWREEVSRAEELIAGTREVISQYISGQRALIRMLKATGVNADSEKVILEIYKKICGLAEQYRVETDVLYDYAEFLDFQNHGPEGIRIAERLLNLYALEDTPKYQYCVLGVLLGRLYSQQNENGKAEQYYRQSLKMLRELSEENGPVYGQGIATACQELAGILIPAERYEEAEELSREALDIIRELAGKNPEGYTRALAGTCISLAHVLIDLKEYPEAETLILEALALHRKDAEDGNAEKRAAIVTSCEFLALLYQDTGRDEEAEKLHLEAVRISSPLAEENPARYQSLLNIVCSRLADYYESLRKLDKAEEYSRKALEISRCLAAENPAAYEGSQACDSGCLARITRDLGKKKEARRFFEEAMTIWRRLAGKNPDYIYSAAICCSELSKMLAKEGKTVQAEILLREELEYYRRLHEIKGKEYPEDIARVCRNLSLLLMDKDRYEEALSYAVTANGIYLRLYEENPSDYEKVYALNCSNLGWLYSILGKYPEAEQVLRMALRIWHGKTAENREEYEPYQAETCCTFGVVLYALEHYEESEAVLREALNIYQELVRKDPETYEPDRAQVRDNLAELLTFLGRKKEAEQLKRMFPEENDPGKY